MSLIIDPTLSKLQCRVYAAIVSCWATYGQSPSQYELRVACQCSSTAIQNALRELRNRGHILSPKFAVRGIKPVDMTRRVLKTPPDPFEELEEAEQFWSHQ